MTETDLTEITGVGPARAEKLKNAGFETAEDVATADLDEISEPLGSAAHPEDVRASAIEAAGMDEEEVSGGDVSVERDPRSDTRELAIESPEYAFYLVKGLADEQLRLRRRNEVTKIGPITDLMQRISSQIGDDGLVFRVDLDDLSSLYTAIRNVEDEISGMRGQGEMIGDMRDLRNEIQSLRDDLWPDT